VIPVAPPEPVPAPAREPDAPASRRGIPHFPALDGLRGLAVAGVLLFHAEMPWMKGGFLGVSTFFTLSGFLITSLLLSERNTSGTIDLRTFWIRRVRRLLPASLAALALIVLFGQLAGDAVQRRNLAGDVLAALAYVANWRFVLADQAYSDIFGEASPVAHFWSLAIEEQFYLLMPVLAWFLLARRRVRRKTFATVLSGLAGASVALALVGGLSTDALYFNTFARAAELLIGALLAVAVFDRRITVPLAGQRRVQAVVGAAGAVALVVAVALWVVTDQSGEVSTWLYRGGLAGYAVISALVILASVTPVGPVRWLLAQAPLRLLGLISYGVYLYHWPIFLWLDEEHTQLSGVALLGVRLGVTLAIAVASYHLLETPIRRRAQPAARPLWLAGPVTAGVIALAVIGVTVSAPAPEIDVDAATGELIAAGRSASGAVAPDVARPDPPFPRAAFFGDSTAIMTGVGFGRWASSTKQAEVVPGVATRGCGIGRGGERLDEQRKPAKVSDGCNRWAFDYRQAIENHQPNIAVVQTGPWEVVDRRLEGDSRWTSLGDPVYDRFLLGEMTEAVDVLSARGAIVVWLTSPPMGNVTDPGPRTGARDPARTDRLNELIRELPRQRPGRVAVVELGGWITSNPNEDERLRPDGHHFSLSTSQEVSERFLADAVLTAYRDTWRARPAASDAAPGQTPDTGRYLTNRYKAVVVGDESSSALADAVADWGRRTKALEVTVSLGPGCGLLDAVARDDGGRVVPTPASCRPPSTRAVDAVKAAKPDLVLVLPSARDMANARLRAGGPVASWPDEAFASEATLHYRLVAEAFNQAGSVVLWVAPPAWVPPAARGSDASPSHTSPAMALGATDEARARAVDNVLRQLATTVPGNGFQRLDLASWAARSVPALRNGADLDTAALRAVGDWLAAQAYLQYDSGPKLERPARR
jgi:peptidoglycan/LPS O-acetylase OafA/YrhL